MSSKVVEAAVEATIPSERFSLPETAGTEVRLGAEPFSPEAI